MWRHQTTDDDYIGNIWGWKFSLFGAFLVLFFIGLAVYLSYSRGKPLLDNTGNVPAMEQPTE